MEIQVEIVEMDTIVTNIPSTNPVENDPILFVFVALTFSVVLLVQVGIFVWRSYAYFSFKWVTVRALCVVPPIVAYLLGWWWFLILWSIFALVSTFAYRKANVYPLNTSTPGMIFSWFHLVHKLSFASVGIGLTIYLIGTFACLTTSHSVWLVDIALTFILYGAYFGLLGRDVAMYITEKMAIGPGYFTINSFPTRSVRPDICALCGHHMTVESMCSLSCEHIFHERCIRGWCMVGKKTICPVCREKVDFQLNQPNPWETSDEILQYFHAVLHWAVVYFPLLTGALGLTYGYLRRYVQSNMI